MDDGEYLGTFLHAFEDTMRGMPKLVSLAFVLSVWQCPGADSLGVSVGRVSNHTLAHVDPRFGKLRPRTLVSTLVSVQRVVTPFLLGMAFAAHISRTPPCATGSPWSATTFGVPVPCLAIECATALPRY